MILLSKGLPEERDDRGCVPRPEVLPARRQDQGHGCQMAIAKFVHCMC